jgi:hypothetical protein
VKRRILLKLFISVLAIMLVSGCNEKRERQTHERGVIDNSKSPYTKLRSLPMQDTRLTEGFWAERFELAATKMLPTLERTMSGGGSANLNRIKEAAGLIEGHKYGTPWGDGDNYKWIESMAHVYNITKDPELDKKMDEWIEIISKAMEPDGYISTNIGHDISKRFQRVNAHECYNMGHLLTAACIHFRATGKENFMEIAKKNADFLYNQWKAEPVHMARYPWNPSVFMGMAEMYRITGNPKYLTLLQIMIDNRGSRPNPDRDHRYGGTDQTQDRVPLREETMAVGHAVTGNYYYCGAADLYAETGDEEILDALERIWKDIHWKKIDITCAVAMGGQEHEISPRGDEVHENFANAPYIQPNGYNETCANIGTGMFNYRMYMLTGKAIYADWTERMMYNTLNSGVDLQGDHWFYCNPLSWDGTEGEKAPHKMGADPNRIVATHHSGVRWDDMNCYCCPPSVTRTTAQIHNWFYNISDDGALWVNFYGGNKLSTTLADGTEIVLSQTTDYPWDGKVIIDIEKIKNKSVPIHFRIPEWTENPVVTINGEKLSDKPKPGSYLKIERRWSVGDKIVLDFPMPIRLMEANPKAVNLNNKVAVMRGPVVYCLELPKQESGEEIYKSGVYLPANIQLTPEHRDDFLGGVTVLKGKALNQKEREAFVKNNPQRSKEQAPQNWKEHELYRPLKPKDINISGKGSVEIELIPYYTWANRGLSYMDVWIPLAR